MIKIKNIHKYYFKNKSNEIHVLNDVNLELEDVGFTTILGPSGSGKSTLLHVIGGLDKAKGQITYDDQEFNKLCNNSMDIYRNKLIGYVFQNYHLLPELTVYQNLKLQLDLIGIDEEEEVDRRIDICLKAINMEKYKRRNVMALSGGQQQRVAIARALVKGAKVIIADEPTGNLDSTNSIEVMNILKALSKTCLVILVTHDQTLAKHYSDRIIRISDGKIVSDIQNDGNDYSLENNNEVIFLDEYKEKILSTDSQKISVFSQEEKDIQLRIVVENNVIYVESLDGKQIKVANEFGSKTIKEKRPEIKKNVVETQENITFESNGEKSFKKTLKKFFTTIKESFLSFFFVKKKTLMVYISFIFIGMLLCCCLSSINYSTTYDASVVQKYPADALRVDAKKANANSAYGYTFEYGEINEILSADSGAIGIVDRLETVDFYYEYVGSRKLKFSPKNGCYATTPTMMNYDFKLRNNEIAIPSILAEEMIEYYKDFGISSEEELLNTQLSISSPIFSGDTVIKHIYEGDNNTILFSDEKYFLIYTFYALYGGGITFRAIEENEEFENLEPLSVTTYLPKVYVSSNLKGYTKKVQDGREIVGYFDSSEFEMVFLNKAEYNQYIYAQIANAGINVLPYEGSEIEIVEGRFPETETEAVVPDVLKYTYSIGSSYGGYTVCGFFKSEYPKTSGFIYTLSKTAYLEKFRNIFSRNTKLDTSYIDFYVSDREKFIAYMAEKGYEAKPLRETVLEEASILKVSESTIAIIISIAISVVMIVFIFFMSRSKMMHSIYSIGVYRAIGAKKSKVYIKYLIDSIILATFTAVLGFLLMYAFVCYADNYIPSLSIKPEYAIGVVLGLYLVMMLASLLPISTLLKKTPIEILGKYDI